MPVELRNESDGDVLRVELSGKLVRDDYEHFTREVERRIAASGKLRMLVEMTDFHGWTAGAAWEDIKFDLKHFSDIERLALVGDKAWERGMAVFCKPFTTASVRYFDKADEAAAVAWVREGLPATAPPA